MLTGIGDDTCLHLMELRVQDIVLDTTALEHAGKKLRGVNVDGADQYRRTGFMNPDSLIDNSLELFLLGLIYRIVEILTDDRLVRRDTDDIHGIDVTEFLLLGLCGTGHAGFFIEFVEEILEGNGCKSL